MSDYWVSKKKYFCKYCDIYIADDVPSRQQHENGLRHKGNMERFIRGLYKEGERRKKDLEEEKREMAQVERAAQIAYAQDVSAGHAKAKAPENVPLPSSSKKNKPSDPWANYSTAASLGYQDPDAERLAAEAGLKQIQGVAGEWEVVAPVKPEGAGAGVGGDQNGDTVPSETIGTKRPVESVFDEEDTRAFKLRKKTLPVGLAAVDDDIISIKIKKKTSFQESAKPNPSASTTSCGEINNFSRLLVPQENPKWSKLEWSKAGRSTDQEDKQIKSKTKREEEAIGLSVESTSENSSRIIWRSTFTTTIPGENQIQKGKFLMDTSDSTKTAKCELDSEPTTPIVTDAAEGEGPVFKKRKALLGAGRGRRPL